MRSTCKNPVLQKPESILLDEPPIPWTRIDSVARRDFFYWIRAKACSPWIFSRSSVFGKTISPTRTIEVTNGSRIYDQSEIRHYLNFEKKRREQQQKQFEEQQSGHWRISKDLNDRFQKALYSKTLQVQSRVKMLEELGDHRKWMRLDKPSL